MALVKTIIDGREIEVERDRWALDVARELGIFIPTLCHHPALEPYGACRLCVVEVTKGKWTWLTTACDLPIREGLSIRTDTPAVIKARRMALELLWAQAPDSEVIRDMAKKMGVDKPRFAPREGMGKCILCGLCVRVCQKVLGDAVIGFSRRGIQRKVTAPFGGGGELSDPCIGCQACVAVCLTGHILSVIEGAVNKIEPWKAELKLEKCKVCGKPFAPVKQLALLQNKSTVDTKNWEKVCPTCRRKRTAKDFHKIFEAVESIK